MCKHLSPYLSTNFIDSLKEFIFTTDMSIINYDKQRDIYSKYSNLLCIIQCISVKIAT